MTKNEEFNKVYATWLRDNPSHSAPECEECGLSLIAHDVTPGPYGWYCSPKCLAAVTDRMGRIPTDNSDRRNERRQMGTY